jgi:hypothetical protein
MTVSQTAALQIEDLPRQEPEELTPEQAEVAEGGCYCTNVPTRTSSSEVRQVELEQAKMEMMLQDLF